jgi:hypothetical protein
MFRLDRQPGLWRQPTSRWALGAFLLVLIGGVLCASCSSQAPLGHNQTPPPVAATPTATSTPLPPPPPQTQWYFADGNTSGSITTQLTLANPNAAPVHVTVQYLLDGAPAVVKMYTVPAMARATVMVNDEVGADKTFAIVATADAKIVAERAMYFTYSLGGMSIPGGTDILGLTALTSSFDFGYLDTTSMHATSLVVLNPNSAAIDAQIRYFAANGAEYDQTRTVPANSRSIVAVNDAQVTSNGAPGQLPAGRYYALVSLVHSGTTNPALGMVERPMYLRDAGTGWTGAADVVGAAAPSMAWYFGGGHVAQNFKQVYFLANPSAGSANAKLTIYKPDGSSVSTSVALAAGQQAMVNVASLPGMSAVDMGTSSIVTADQPILAERYLSFHYVGGTGSGGGSSIPGATDVMGTTAPGHTFLFAEGNDATNYVSYLQILNPDPSQTAQMTATFLSAKGAPPRTVTFSLPPHARFSGFPTSVMPLQTFALILQSNVPVVAERGMFFAYGGTQTGGTNVIGYQPPGS